jgi:hypothetical protein
LAKRKAKKKKASRRSTSRRTKSRRVSRQKVKRKPNVLVYIALLVIVVFALAFSLPSGNNGLDTGTGDTGTTWQEQTTETTETAVQQSEYPCKSNSECFVINCKETPGIIECINAVALETYGRDNCDNYNNVDVDQDLMICRCMGGFCTLDI